MIGRVGHVGVEDGGFDDVREVGTGGGEDVGEVGQGLAAFSFEPTCRDLARCRVHAGLCRDEDEVTDSDGG